MYKHKFSFKVPLDVHVIIKIMVMSQAYQMFGLLCSANTGFWGQKFMAAGKIVC